MLKQLERFGRAAATGFCFAVFGTGQLILGFIAFPLLMLFTPKGEARKRLAKRGIQLSFRAFVELMRFCRVLDYRVDGTPKLKRSGLLVMANHPTLIDVVFLIGFLPQADCVVKASLFRNPFIRFAITAAGYISNGQDPETVMAACQASFDAGNSLVIFPEGTRSTPGQPLTMQRGAAQIAVRCKRDMTPVLIFSSRHNIGKESKWWQVPEERVQYRFDVQDDLPIAPYISGDQEPAMAARKLTDFLTGYFNTRALSHAD